MKGHIILILGSFVILNVCAGRIYDEKTEAKKEIERKFQEAVTLANSTQLSAENEKKLVTDKGEVELKKYLDTKITDTKLEFERDASAVIRTAIVQAKPISVIYCIRKVLTSGYNQCNENSRENRERVLQVKIKKLEKIEFDIYAIKAIISGLKELVTQALNKINEGSGTIQDIKKEAVSRCESALLLLGEIEVCLHEPILTREYIKARQEIDRSLKQLKTQLYNELLACVK